MTDCLHISARQWVVPAEDGFILGRRTSVLRRIRGGRELTEILDAIFAQLKAAPVPLESLCDVLKPRFPTALVIDAVHQFLSLGILVRRPVTDVEQQSDPLRSYFAEQTDDEAVRVERLKASRVLILGAGQLATWTATALSEVGVVRIDQVRPTSAVDPMELAPLWSVADLVIACADDPTERLRLFQPLNDVHLQHELPWLIAHLNGDQVLLGPLLVPRETGCYRCLEMREESRLPHRAEFLAFKRHVSSRWEVQSADHAPPAARIASGAIAMEAVRILSWVGFPATFRTMIAMDLRSFEVEHHTLLRVPFCDACGPHVTRPFSKPWSV